jgi:hypothetical protein
VTWSGTATTLTTKTGTPVAATDPCDIVRRVGAVSQQQIEKYDVYIAYSLAQKFVDRVGGDGNAQIRGAGHPRSHAGNEHPVVVNRGDPDHAGHLSSTQVPVPTLDSTTATPPISRIRAWIDSLIPAPPVASATVKPAPRSTTRTTSLPTTWSRRWTVSICE